MYSAHAKMWHVPQEMLPEHGSITLQLGMQGFAGTAAAEQKELNMRFIGVHAASDVAWKCHVVAIKNE